MVLIDLSIKQKINQATRTSVTVVDDKYWHLLFRNAWCQLYSDWLFGTVAEGLGYCPVMIKLQHHDLVSLLACKERGELMIWLGVANAAPQGGPGCGRWGCWSGSATKTWSKMRAAGQLTSERLRYTASI